MASTRRSGSPFRLRADLEFQNLGRARQLRAPRRQLPWERVPESQDPNCRCSRYIRSHRHPKFWRHAHVRRKKVALQHVEMRARASLRRPGYVLVPRRKAQMNEKSRGQDNR